MPNHVEGAWIYAIGERVREQEERDFEQMRIARTLDAVPLQRAQIIGIPEFAPQLFEDLPVTTLALLAECGDQMTAKILDDRVVVQQCVVDVQEEDSVGHGLEQP